MTHVALTEQFVPLAAQPRSRLADGWAPAPPARSVPAERPPAREEREVPLRRSGGAITGAVALGRGALWTLRALGAVLGIVTAVVLVGALVVAQRLLHLE